MCPVTPALRSPQHHHSQYDSSRKQKMAEMQLFDQQFAILNDIIANNNQYEGTQVQQQQQLLTVPQPQNQVPQYTTVDTPPQYQHHVQPISQCSQTQQPLNGQFISSPTSQPPPLVSPSDPQKQIADAKNSPGYSPSTSPITSVEIRIPSPKKLNYVPNTTDVIISTPQVSAISGVLLNTS